MLSVSALLVCLRRALPEDSDFGMYERLGQTFSGAAVRIHTLGAKDSSYPFPLQEEFLHGLLPSFGPT